MFGAFEMAMTSMNGTKIRSINKSEGFLLIEAHAYLYPKNPLNISYPNFDQILQRHIYNFSSQMLDEFEENVRV